MIGPLSKPELNTLNYIKSLNSKFEPKIFFDVGAHYGSVTNAFKSYKTDCTVHLFEPVSATFEILQKNLSNTSGVILNKLALSNEVGEKNFTCGRNTGNRFATGIFNTGWIEQVAVITGDEYCNYSKIEKIDYLKIDAEGADLDVLIGFKNLLSRNAVDYIQVECTPDNRNSYHVQFIDLINFLSFFNYSLFCLGEMKHIDNEKNKVTSGIWYCNAIFSNQLLGQENNIG